MTRIAPILAIFLITTSAMAETCDVRKLNERRKVARDLSDSGKKAEAVQELKKLDNICPHPRNLMYICKIYQGWSGHCAEGLVACNRFLEACPSCTDRERGQKLRVALDESCHAQVNITSDPSNVLVVIDGSVVGRTPISKRLMEGEHSITSTSFGRVKYTNKLRVNGGQSRQEHHILLKPIRSEKSVISDLSGADIKQSRTSDASKDVYLGAAWAGVVLVIVGGVTSAIYLNEYYEKKEAIDDIKNACGPGEECTGPGIKGSQADAETATKLSAVGLGVAVAGGMSAMIFFGLSLDEKQTVTLQPVVDSNSVGFRLDF